MGGEGKGGDLLSKDELAQKEGGSGRQAGLSSIGGLRKLRIRKSTRREPEVWSGHSVCFEQGLILNLNQRGRLAVSCSRPGTIRFL